MSEIKIRTLPRSNERKFPADARSQKRLISRIMIAFSVAVFFGSAFGYWTSTREPVQRTLAKVPKVVDRLSASVNEHLVDTHLKEDLIRRKFELENRETAPTKLEVDAEPLPEDNRTYGVQFEQDSTLDQLYEDLNSGRGSYGADIQDKINQRLANRKWLNEQERAERITFIKNFIRSAYNRGYEVQINADLVVTGVKRIEHPKQVNIEQVLDRIAKQGQ